MLALRGRANQLPKYFPQSARFISKKSWVPVREDQLQDYTVKALTWEMEQFQRKSAERTVPWFLKNLPVQYFEEINADIQRDHLRALTALSEAGLASNAEEEITKLCEFCSKGNLDRVKYLISLGADPNQGDYDGRTPFHLAASEGHFEVIRYLAELPESNLNVTDRWGNTPLDDATRSGKTDVIEYLRAHGAKEHEDGPVNSGSKMDKKENGSGLDLMIKSRNQRFVSFFNNDFTPHAFGSLVKQLNANRPIHRAKAFVALDDSLLVSVFEYGGNNVTATVSEEELRTPGNVAEDIHEYNEEHGLGYSTEELNNLMVNFPKNYLKFTPRRAFFDQLKMVEEVHASHGTRSVGKVLPNEHTNERGSHWAYLCSPNVWTQTEMKRLMDFIGSEGFSLERYHMDQLAPMDGDVVLSRALLTPPDGMVMDEEKLTRMANDLCRLKYLDDYVLQWYEMCHGSGWTLQECEVVHALGNMIFGVLNKETPHAYTLDRLRETLMMQEHRSTSHLIAKLFIDRFDPENTCRGAEFERRSEEIRHKIDENIQTTIWQKLFHKMVDAVESTLRTNLHLKHRMCLTLRIDPELMMAKEEVDRVRPYGVFFANGRRFNGFQCRFREIARGGLRVVPANTGEQFGLESTRHFDEVYGLSYAQQLKNKDIPEGGSKAVVLCNVSHRNNLGSDYIVRHSVKYFGDGLLDLMTPDEEVQSKLVDYLGKPELLYLGPDENIIPSDINWLVERAAQRGMKYPAAFMSSKPEAGINHKVYGVTSEGVAVFLHQSLLESGIDPNNQTFTVKLTGGPNGDVAGNMIKIFLRDYGSNCKVVGMSDATGVVESADGLDMEELYRLHKEDLPIEAYNPDLLNGGEMHLVNSPEGIQKRNSMHNRLVADVFVPAGGRPNTINALNWKHYMQSDGTPSSPIIVEAANIFTTPEARKLLGENGVKIVKDSSANKCGVCCSSYEIVSSMLLSKEEFLDHKEEIVEDVLVRLREIARMEAEQLFRESKLNPDVQMPDIAVQISAAIERVTDLFDNMLENEFEALDYQTRRRLMIDSLPKKLVELAYDRLDDLPLAYIRAMISSSLASRLVYKEGTEFVNNLEDQRLLHVARGYMQSKDHVERYLEALENSNLNAEERQDIKRIVELYGVRACLDNL